MSVIPFDSPIYSADESDILALLDAEISKVSSKANLEDRKKLASSKVNNSRSSTEVRLAAKRELFEINLQLQAIQWEPIGNVALFTIQHCDNCGSDHRLFVQHMERLRTRTGPKVIRLARTSCPHPGLERSCLIQRTTTHFCADCCGELGYDLEAGEVKFNGEPFGLSPTYHQEEINEHHEA